MNPITVQDLQAIAVQCTSDFFNSGVPLSEGLSKIASERNLNPEQLKRAVEATNTLTYLKSVEVGSDRTGEFPLADYDDIVKMASIPESLFTKVASTEEPKSFSESALDYEGMVKQAEEALTYTPPVVAEMTSSEVMLNLVKQASINRRALEDATDKSYRLLEQLEKTASELRGEPRLVEILSAVSRDRVEFVKLASLTGCEMTRYLESDLASYLIQKGGGFRSAMTKAASLSADLEKAAGLVAEIKERTELNERVTPLVEGLQKQAFLGATAGVVGRALGSALGGTAKTLVGTPVKTVGKAAVNGFKATVDTAATKTQNWAANSSAGKAIGVTRTSVSPTTLATKKRSARNLAIAGAGLDAASFTPKTHSDAPASGDVWAALNG